MIEIKVPLPHSPYTVKIKDNLLLDVSTYVNKNEQIVLITDSNIPKKYIETITSQFSNILVLTVSPGEHSKSMETAYSLINKMIENNVNRQSVVLALGGGVVGDLAGFIASIYFRGIDFIQIPTSLLAMIDSSVGGKVGINAKSMKNAIGSFHQPRTVLIDPLTLKTLEKRHVNNGIAEMIKYGMISSKTLYESLYNDTNIMNNIHDYIAQCITIKKDIVLQDEKDYGLRQLLNYGHTIGHALEQDSNYELLHGEAISEGMLHMAVGYEYYDSLHKILDKYNLITNYEYDSKTIYSYIQNDKKVRNNIVSIVLVKAIGNGFIKDICLKDIKRYLR